MLDLTKPVETRDGRKVRILCTDRVGERPIIGLITGPDGKETYCAWNTDGTYVYREGRSDLINTKKKLYLLVWSSSVNEKYVVAHYENDAARTTAIAICKKQGWKVNKVFEIEVD